MEKYVILRDLNRTTDESLQNYTRQTRDILRTPPGRRSMSTGNRRSGPSPSDFTFEGTRSTSGATPPDNLPEPKVETAELNDKERRDAAADPDVKGFAVIMPTMLLAPVARDQAGAQAAGDSWGIGAVGADGIALDGAGVRVCVLDTGIDITHPAFAGVALTKRDFTTGVTGGQPIDTHPNWDVDGHGTHCAGTIFGRNVGGTRIGIARGVSDALIGKVLDDQGRGNTDMLFAGLQWAITAGVDVVSMSIGFDFPGLVERRIQTGWNPRQATSNALVAYGANMRLFDTLMGMVRARAAFDEGTVIVAASGNESAHEQKIHIAASLPAAADGMISVGALQQAGGKHATADFSNSLPSICAPGVAIRSAKTGGGLTAMSGTSMACPHVAGVAALWWQHLRATSPDGQAKAAEVVAHLTAMARKEDVLFEGGFIPEDHGAGMVRVPQAGV